MPNSVHTPEVLVVYHYIYIKHTHSLNSRIWSGIYNSIHVTLAGCFSFSLVSVQNDAQQGLSYNLHMLICIPAPWSAICEKTS